MLPGNQESNGVTMGAIEFGANGLDGEWGGSVMVAVGCCQMANFEVGVSWRNEGETELGKECRRGAAQRNKPGRIQWTL